MKKILSFFAVAAVVFMTVAGCTKYETPANTDKPPKEETGNPSEPGKEPEIKIWNIGTHRGGYLESKLPDCSLAGLKYSIGLGCKYSECDIVLTKDNDILVIHPKRVTGVGDVVNNVIPSQKTAEEIRALGRLNNGEKIPTLREYITYLQNKDNNPVGHTVMMDVKEMMVGNTVDYQLSINACLRAAEIVKEMNAQDIMEFIIPSGTNIYPHVRERIINEFKMNIGWMTATSPSKYEGGWAQLRWDKVIGKDASYDPQVYFNANVPLTIYWTVSTKEEDASICDLTVPYYPHVKCLFTNYPKQLIYKLKDAGY